MTRQSINRMLEERLKPEDLKEISSEMIGDKEYVESLVGLFRLDELKRYLRIQNEEGFFELGQFVSAHLNKKYITYTGLKPKFYLFNWRESPSQTGDYVYAILFFRNKMR